MVFVTLTCSTGVSSSKNEPVCLPSLNSSSQSKLLPAAAKLPPGVHAPDEGDAARVLLAELMALSLRVEAVHSIQVVSRIVDALLELALAGSSGEKLE